MFCIVSVYETLLVQWTDVLFIANMFDNLKQSIFSAHVLIIDATKT